MKRTPVPVLLAILLVVARATADEPTQTPVFVSGQDGYHTYRIPSLLVTSKGTLLAFCEGRKKSSSDTGDIDLLLRRSLDGGKTWQKTQMVWDDGANTCGNPCPVVERDSGTVWLLLTHNLGADTEAQILDGKSKGTRSVWVCKSDDDGVTWSKPVEITKDVKKADWTWYATGPGVGIQTKSGRLVIPCDNYVAGSKARQSHVIYSDDRGKTWKLGGVVGPGCNECQVAERADGSLLLNMRSYRGNNRRLVSISKDGGETWSKPEPDDALIEPVCQASLVRHPGGLLFANPASKKREKMTVRLSKDDGKTWPLSRVLHDGPAAYSCLVALPDGEAGCLYERGDKRPYETITFARFSLKSLTGEAPKKPRDNPGETFGVINRKTLAADRVECERIAVGEPDDYKPCVALLPGGELLMTAFHQHKKDGGKVLEQTLLFRSKDGGRTWSKPEKLDLLGREPYLTVLKDGTIFITGHLLAQDVRNPHGYTHGYLHRSTDGGKSWQTIRIESEGIKPKASNHTSRNVAQLADGTLLLGVDYDGGGGPYFMWRSKDNGKTWDRTQKCNPVGFKSQYGFFGGETWLWPAKSGRLWALVRVDSNEFPIEGRSIKSKNDQSDHFILYSSDDQGRTFRRVSDFGDYGEMYMSILRLQDRRLLLTFTVRDLNPPLGVRAIPGVESDTGFSFDFSHDRLMLDTKTGSRAQGGGFGPTVQLADGTLVTSCSYRGPDDRTHLEVIRWKLPAAK